MRVSQLISGHEVRFECNEMDFVEFAKWGIRVKEEPGTLGPFHVDKRNESNFRGHQGGWMCKFPCDVEGTLDTAAATDNLLYHDLQLEPFAPTVNYLEEGHGHFNLQTSDKFNASALPESNNKTIPRHDPAHLTRPDASARDRAAFRNTIEENVIVNGLSSSRESFNEEEERMLETVLQQCDISEDLAPAPGAIIQREFVQCLPKKAAGKRPAEEACIAKNQNEILRPSHTELLVEAPENAVAELVKNNGAMDISLNVKNNISREIESLPGESVAKAQQNSRNENNNDCRVSEISSFECAECGEVLKSFNGFITHMNSHIIEEHGNIDTILCENCNQSFDDDISFSFHKKECNSTKGSNCVPSQNKHDNNSNNAVCLTVSCSEKNSISNEQCASEGNSGLDLSSHCQETSLKNLPEEQTSHHQDLSSFSPKRRPQAYMEECSSSEMSEKRNSWTVQNLGAADDSFDVSWSSEIKCREEREGRSLGSVRTLSLRLFRFRRPKVIVKRAKVPVQSESVIKTINPNLGESVSNIINERSVYQDENSANCKEVNKEPVISGVDKLSKSGSDVTNSSHIVQPYRKPKQVLHSEKGYHFARQLQSTDPKKNHMQANSTAVHSEPRNIGSVVSNKPYSFSSEISEKDKKSDEPDVNVSNKFPTENTKVRSNLKIKIKPIVVLDRLNSIKFNHNSSKSTKDDINKCVGVVSSQKNVQSDIQSNIGSSASEICEISKVETNSKEIAKTLVEQSSRDLDSCHDAIKQSENRISLVDLEKRYCLKKCYVKLKRLSLEPCSLRKIRKHRSNKDVTGCEIKTCGKIKLRRMSSKVWAVSSCSSALENIEVTRYAEEKIKNTNPLCVAKHFEKYSTNQEVHNEIWGERSKQCSESKDSSISLRESSEENLRKHMPRGKPVKRLRTECTCCQKTFFDEQDLAQHLETHLSGFKCPNCSARFHFVMELHAHEAGCSLATLLDCHKAEALIKPCQVVL